MVSRPSNGLAVFLDRDGVLIKSPVRDGKPYAVIEGEIVEILPGVAEACAALSIAGYLLIMVTNQPDVARGKTPRAFVEGVNARLVVDLGLDEALVCYHDNNDRCDCRKPKPGLMLDAARRYGLELAHCVMVGDRWRDVEAGRNAGMLTVFIDYGYDEKATERPDYVADSLTDAAQWILHRLRSASGLQGSCC